MAKRVKKIILHPVMAMLVLAFGIILISFILSLFNVAASYNVLSINKMDYTITTEAVNSLLSLRGIKYIFSNTALNFANFAPLSHLIIILLGIGVMEYSGFLKTSIGMLTKHAKKNTITFVIVLISILASIVDNLAFVAFIPLAALIYKYGKRNPNIGIIASFAGLTCGYGLSIFFTSVDSSLAKITTEAASLLDATFTFKTFSMVLIMIIAIIVLAFVITYITEEYITLKLPKYIFEETEVLTEEKLTKPQAKGLLLAGLGSALYLIIFIYNIIPGLPFSGNFLNYSENIYIDKLFGADSFFANGFVFIITILFIIWGLLYGIGAKTIKNNRDFIESLGHNLNGIGRTLLIIFASSTFISIFKQTNIGNVITAFFASIISGSSFSGLALVVLLFVFSFIATIFAPSTIGKWQILAYSVVPTFMNVGISPVFTQVIYRFGETAALGLTPLFGYFCVYLAYLDKYNQDDTSLNLRSAIKYQTPYSMATSGILLVIIILFYLLGLPLGFGGTVTI